jgi:hypothetical protein
MRNNRQTTRYSNTVAALYQKLRHYFSSRADDLKAEFVRMAVWVSIVMGA